MKLSALYANKADIFPPIKFHEGFNVVFARVKNPKIKEKDSHNLGKTFLITVIDFCLLAEADKHHPFKIHSEVFKDFVFYLEIKTHSGHYVTVRRLVEGRNPVSIHVSHSPNTDLTRLFEPSWTYADLPLTKAIKQLNDLLDLSAIAPYNYRKGLGYILRRQTDYDELFRISKFSRSADKDWKPFLAQIIGFNHAIIDRKYELDETVDKLKLRQQTIEEEAGSTSEEYDEVKGLLEIRSSTLEGLRTELDQFSFRGVEAVINEDLVSNIESNIANLNRRRYTIDYELTEIAKSLETGFEFDLNRVQQVFAEAQLELPQALVHSYKEVIELNRRMSDGRKERLHKLRDKLERERAEIENLITDLDSERTAALAILEEKQTLEKYRKIQRRFSQQEAQVIVLQQRLADLDRAANIQKDIDTQRQKVNDAIQEIRESVRHDNSTYTAIRTTFSRCVERVLNVQALLSVSVNQEGNLDFNVRTLDPEMSGRETSEGAGASYKKILCACFDIAVVGVYASKPFYHFLYHDGIFEGLDNRKKVNLLNLIRDITINQKIQYILTVIDSDLPRDERDMKLLFTQEEIVRELHDEGDSGRLFKMPPF
ncbi:MAG: DUF2326 domain-containing protein [Abitibacteriaceae bacterium]|nr:DUF2326 domain-containing protein [Abditibacteriaceae bacterium]